MRQPRRRGPQGGAPARRPRLRRPTHVPALPGRAGRRRPGLGGVQRRVELPHVAPPRRLPLLPDPRPPPRLRAGDGLGPGGPARGDRRQQARGAGEPARHRRPGRERRPRGARAPRVHRRGRARGRRPPGVDGGRAEPTAGGLPRLPGGPRDQRHRGFHDPAPDDAHRLPGASAPCDGHGPRARTVAHRGRRGPRPRPVRDPAGRLVPGAGGRGTGGRPPSDRRPLARRRLAARGRGARFPRAAHPQGPRRAGAPGRLLPGPALAGAARPGRRHLGRGQVGVPPVVGAGDGGRPQPPTRHLPLRRLQGGLRVRRLREPAALRRPGHRPLPPPGSPRPHVLPRGAHLPRAPAQREEREGPRLPGGHGRPGVPSVPGHRGRRVRRPGPRGPRVHRRDDRYRAARAVPGAPPHPGHAAPGGRHQGQPPR